MHNLGYLHCVGTTRKILPSQPNDGPVSGRNLLKEWRLSLGSTFHVRCEVPVFWEGSWGKKNGGLVYYNWLVGQGQPSEK